jgi:CRISPR-associated protein Csm4
LTRLKAAFNASEPEQIKLWDKSDVPRVTVDRVTSASSVYQAGRVTFAPKSGLWLGLQFYAPDLASTVEAVLRVLGDAGLGGERSSGHGQYELNGNEEIDLPDAGMRFTTLSPYWPQPDEVATVLMGDARYTLMAQRGWMGSPDSHALRRKMVRMLSEGSVLTTPDKSILGGLADVTPDALVYPDSGERIHDVYRYGYALPVGFYEGNAT